MLEVESSSDNDTFTSRHHLHAFIAALPTAQCRFAIYNFRFLTGEGGNMYKLIFIVWCPHEADDQEREQYAAARSSVRRQMAGISCEVLAQSPEDLEYDTILRFLGA